MWHWLLTSTTYGTWLPGDPRGSVTSVRDYRETDTPTDRRVEHDRPGETWEPPLPSLRNSAQQALKSEPIWLTREQAETLAAEFQRTASYRDWRLLAVAIMSNHFHLAVCVPTDIDPNNLLKEFKAYGSRSLSQRFGKPAAGTWWTKSGSKRKLPNETAVASAINYVLKKQPNPLVTWNPRRLNE